MKKTVNVAIGGCSFIIDEDAYCAMNEYLEDFRNFNHKALLCFIYNLLSNSLFSHSMEKYLLKMIY